ncbi:MAG: phosphoglucosamine mutase [Clostridia bacterium]|jgi:phosphoglucosamine mutase|nr:phosphoglucosamine mutase [Clostridia bacterium]
MGRLFGTDGVRGIANGMLTCDLAFKLGQAGAFVLTSQVHKARILIGRDTRISGNMLEAAMVAGICSVGAEAVVAGVIPTSGVAFLTRDYEADAGVVISASHNSVEYNGIKFFNSEGKKLPDEVEDRIERIILDGSEEIKLQTGINIGRKVSAAKGLAEYKEFLISAADTNLRGLKIVLDCAHGAASFVGPRSFTELGAEVIPYYNTPDGTNINDYCGSTYPQKLTQLVAELGADMGFAFDGDADRLIAVDEHGVIVDGDEIMAICAVDLKKRGLLKRNTLVCTVMSNLGLDIAMKKNGIKTVKTNVGDRYVLEEMIRGGYSLGGEQSGHIIFLDDNTTGDGILTGLMLASIVMRRGKSLSKLADVVKILPQVLINAKVKDEHKDHIMEDEEVKKRIKKLDKHFHGNGRVLIRPSGTEPLVRVMIEGKDKKEIERQAVEMVKLIESRLA